MLRLSMFALLGGVLVLSSGVVGQEAKKAVQDKKDVKKDEADKLVQLFKDNGAVLVLE